MMEWPAESNQCPRRSNDSMASPAATIPSDSTAQCGRVHLRRKGPNQWGARCLCTWIGCGTWKIDCLFWDNRTRHQLGGCQPEKPVAYSGIIFSDDHYQGLIYNLSSPWCWSTWLATWCYLLSFSGRFRWPVQFANSAVEHISKWQKVQGFIDWIQQVPHLVKHKHHQ